MGRKRKSVAEKYAEGIDEYLDSPKDKYTDKNALNKKEMRKIITQAKKREEAKRRGKNVD